MFDFNSNGNHRARRPNLYCVWIRAHEGENAPLIQVWIDPTMSQFEAQNGAHVPDQIDVNAEAPVANSIREDS